MKKIKELFNKLKAKNETLGQLVTYLLLGGITTAIDLAVFALCNYVIFKKYADESFNWWLIKYSPHNGGLCAFLSFAVSFAIAQTFNFFIQRKATFKATNNTALSGVMYAVMVLGTYVVVLWLPRVVGKFFYSAFGRKKGAIVLKMASQSLSAIIQFPINKWVIMRKRSN